MTMFAVSKNLFRRFYSCSSRQAMISSQTNNSFLLTYLDSCLDSKLRRYYCGEKKWITIILEKEDGTRFKRKGKIGFTLQELLMGDTDFSGYGQCEGRQSCSTCHVIFTKEDFNTISKYNLQTTNEADLLADMDKYSSSIKVNFQPDRSRLGCCIQLLPQMDGMVIQIPEIKVNVQKD